MKTKQYTLLTKQLPSGEVRAGDIACGRGNCPAVLKAPDGKAIVIGRMLSKKQQSDIARTGLVSFHNGEIGVEVQPELLRKLAGLL